MSNTKQSQGISWDYGETIEIWVVRDNKLSKEQATAVIAGDTGLAYRLHHGFPTYKDSRNRFGITHIKSGMEFQMFFFSELAVQRAIEAIVPLANWHRDAEYLRKHPLLKDLMANAVKDIGFEVDFKGERA
jgi:hypothetical protein